MNEKAWLQERFGILNYLLVFVTGGLTVRAPILRFCEEKHTRQSFGLVWWQGYHEGKTGGVVQTN